MINRFIAVLLLIVLSPLFIIIALIIIVDDGFPVFYRQKRVGMNNIPFSIFKFRTMQNDLPDIPTHQVENPALLYIKTGSLLRKLSFDELPQLLNIIKGDMVFIGPRPALYNQDDLIKLRTDANIHQLVPGITGWAQVNGRDDLSIPIKVSYDQYYLNNQSPFLNIKIIILTVFKVLSMKSVSH